MKNKKADSQYISWILIFAMIVAISYMLYNWSIQQARKTSEDIESRTDPITCSEAGIQIDGVCQTFRSLELNLTNQNTLEIDGFQIREIGLYPDQTDYIHTEDIILKISPGSSEKISILKKGTLSQIKIVPLIKKDNKNILCEEKSVVKDKDSLKQC